MRIPRAFAFLLVTSLPVFGQTTEKTIARPPVTMFLHQTLGESWEDFMSITGSKLDPCGSGKSLVPQWCESFKKIEANGQGELTDNKNGLGVSLVFSQKRLMQVLVHGKADFSKSVAELNEKYGLPDSQSAQTAVWSFADGGGITAVSKPGNEVVIVYYCKEGKDEIEQAMGLIAPRIAPTQSTASAQSQSVTSAVPVAPTTFRNFVLGETMDDIVTAGLVNMSLCEHPKGETKRICQDIEKARAGQSIGLQIQNDKSGRVTLLFEGGKLLEIRVDPALSSSFAEQVTLLVQKYGKPTLTDTVTEANAMGARWECGEAYWNMPDGSIIFVSETVAVLDYLGPTRIVTVNFTSAERLKKQSAARQAGAMKY